MSAAMQENGGKVASLVDLIERRLHEPERAVYRFLGAREETSLSVAQLWDRCRSAGSVLAGAHDRGSRVLLLLPPGSAFVVGFLSTAFAGLVAVPVAVPGRSRLRSSLPSLLRIADDCRPAAILAVAEVRELLEPMIPEGHALAAARWHDLAAASAMPPERWTAPSTSPDDPTLLQYTSGSTAAPKGVAVTTANLMANLAAIGERFATTPADRAMVWLPPHHDMGLIGGILEPLFGGFEVDLMAPSAFAQAPQRWLRAVSDRQITISGGPDFAYRLCVERVRDDHLDGLDLSSWRLAFTGAEPVSGGTLRAFADRFAAYGFDRRALYPCYGLAESTLMATGGTAGSGVRVVTASRRALIVDRRLEAGAGDDRRELVSCGRAPRGSELRIVDPETHHELPDRNVGEIWLRGPSVAAGYHDDPDRTLADFGALTEAGDGPFLRSGDLGCIDDGELFVTGRLKDVVVVDGRCLDAVDVEGAVEGALPSGRTGSTAAIGVMSDRGERLVVVQELGRSATGASGLGTRVQAAVAEHCGIRPAEVVFVPLGALPRTTSGKLRRREIARLLELGELPRLPVIAGRAD